MLRRRGGQMYSIEKLVGHRWTFNGFEYKVQWKQKKRTNYPDSWEPEKNITEDQIELYKDQLAMAVDSRIVSVNIAPLVQLARKNLAQTVATVKTQARPRIHEALLEGFALLSLGMAFLEVVRNPWALALYMAASSDDAPVEHELLPIVEKEGGVFEVHYTKIEHISAFCAFESFLSPKQGVGCLRYNMGRWAGPRTSGLGKPLAEESSTANVYDGGGWDP